MLSGFLAVIDNKTPPSTVRGELATPCILVWIGKMESGFTCILAKRDLGITVSWAPVSHTDSVGLDLPRCFPADNLGIAKLSSDYARLSMEKVTGKVAFHTVLKIVYHGCRNFVPSFASVKMPFCISKGYNARGCVQGCMYLQ